MTIQAKKTTPLLPVYLIVGEDELKRNTVLNRLRTRFSTMGDISFNCDKFNGETAAAGDIVNACNTMPFVSSMRLVEVQNAHKLQKADREILVSYLDAPNETTVLALIAEKLAKNIRLYKAVAKYGKTAIIDCTPPRRFELPRMVCLMAKTYGVTLSTKAAETLISLVGENTLALDGELKKIALTYKGSKTLHEQDITALINCRAEVKPWEFVNALSERDIARCMFCLQHMDSVSPYALLSLCTCRLRELMCAQSLLRDGDISAVAQALTMPEWRVKNHGMWARQFSAVELQTALIAARDCEIAMKSGSDPQAAFVEWVLFVIRGNGKSFRCSA